MTSTLRERRRVRIGATLRFVPFCEQVGLHLEPFQQRIAAAAAGSQHELLVLLPRGNGKTTLLAAIALHHLITVPNAAVYCAASSREQARILYEAAAMFARTLDHPNVVVRHLELRWCDDPDEPNVFTRHLRVLAADAPKLHGLTPSLAIIDELHAHPDDEVYVALRTATLKRPDSRLITISTAGQGADSALGRLRARALGQPHVQRRGAFTDASGPTLRMFEWSVPDDDDLIRTIRIKKANPASWITVHGLREQREAVAEVAFRRYHCNQWTAAVGAWLPAGAWQNCAGKTEFTDGERIWVGVDVGGERSASAVVYVNERLHVGVETWVGDEAVLEVAAYVAELAENYEIVEAVYDPWRAGQMAQEWEQRGIRAVAFPQSDARMIPACERLYDAVVHQELRHPDDPDLNRHVHAAVARHGRRGWRLEKPDRSTNIDAAVAMAMAIDRHAYQPQTVELLGWL